MKISEELKARGLIAQMTDEQEICDLIDQGKAVYFDGRTSAAVECGERGHAAGSAAGS